ncbi:class I SAM-dependent RNA methyltransferase [Bdellovibrio sp. NC01]|uniref:class I SAM-dependent RNA methyltransferase n=1 Tax=Bdellovibrio sp. NC01 TaxID=2220073 RepID=UPI00115B99A2|nr:class I SAM-dependent RNA methyltransferase [Bdellovibrio sp. NC01]QDK37842.1 RNA methyltransferase [Bdellovibrio sp. NC01]
MQSTPNPLNQLLECPYQQTCSGCQYLHMPYGEQLNQKQGELAQIFARKDLQHPPIEILSAGAGHLRDRLDFSLQGGRLGLYGKGTHDIVDLETCAQLSPALQEWLTEFRRFEWPVEKGSIRLRVGPDGQKGVWLDFANVDIKKILDEQTILRGLLEVAFVEIGQRRKVPVWTGSEFKLKDPELNVWFETWMGETPVDLYCHVASFTQPSLEANKIIASQITKWISQFTQSRVIEFGSGIGNLTLPALASASSVLACEIDALSLEGLEKTLERLPASLKDQVGKLQIHRGDFQKKILNDFTEFDGILANPPRSGLMGFLDPLEKLNLQDRPKFFIYMSCFPESMAADLVKLKNFGYEMKECVIVDQFPQSTHFEVLSLLQRK